MGERNKAINGANGEYPMAYKYPIDLKNVIPQIDGALENGYTKEEMKMVLETKKIMRDESIRVTSTTVRIPVRRADTAKALMWNLKMILI